MARRSIERLEEHPNSAEVLHVLARLSHIHDRDLPRLADAWRNNAALAQARDAALRPDSPLVLEVLAAFDALDALFEEDLLGKASYITVPPNVTTMALRAVRDALAAAYARPVLSRRQHAQLLRPWRTVFPSPALTEPYLGPHAEVVKGLLGMLPRLAGRCHDGYGAATYASLVEQAAGGELERRDARDLAFAAAVRTDRRRTWVLVRRSAAESLSRPCGTCGRQAKDPGLPVVLGLFLDAACGLLVADAVPQDQLDVLTSPVRGLIPRQRAV